jgi:hypothetical protein
VIDTTAARVSAEFWRQLLGLVYRVGHEPPSSEQDDAAGRDWLNLFTPEGNPRLGFQQVPALEPTTWPDDAVPQQLHLDLTVDTVDELDAVHEPVLELGGELRFDRPTTRTNPCGSSSTLPVTHSASSSTEPSVSSGGRTTCRPARTSTAPSLRAPSAERAIAT